MDAIKSKEFTDYNSILENGLFASPNKLTFINISQTHEDTKKDIAQGSISLVGTVLLHSKNGYAVFEEADSKKQEVFKKGENVFGIGILTDIKKDMASVTAGDKKMDFEMPISDNAPQEKSGGPVFAASQKTGEKDWIIDQKALSKTVTDMSKVLTDARLLPYKEGDKVIGFRVSEVKPDGIFNLIGLKNGDILIKVNNYEIDSPEKGVQLLTGLKGESNISIDIIRDEKKMNMNYQIR